MLDELFCINFTIKYCFYTGSVYRGFHLDDPLLLYTSTWCNSCKLKVEGLKNKKAKFHCAKKRRRQEAKVAVNPIFLIWILIDGRRRVGPDSIQQGVLRDFFLLVSHAVLCLRSIVLPLAAARAYIHIYIYIYKGTHYTQIQVRNCSLAAEKLKERNKMAEYSVGDHKKVTGVLWEPRRYEKKATASRVTDYAARSITQ